MNRFKQITISLMLVAVAFAIACDSAASNDPNSPTGVTKRFVKAVQARNVAEYKANISKKSLDKMNRDAKEVGVPTDTLLAKALEENMFGKPDGKDIETRSEKISGDKATVQFKDGNGKWLENDLVKENGVWKVELE